MMCAFFQGSQQAGFPCNRGRWLLVVVVTPRGSTVSVRSAAWEPRVGQPERTVQAAHDASEGSRGGVVVGCRIVVRFEAAFDQGIAFLAPRFKRIEA